MKPNGNQVYHKLQRVFRAVPGFEDLTKFALVLRVRMPTMAANETA